MTVAFGSSRSTPGPRPGPSTGTRAGRSAGGRPPAEMREDRRGGFERGGWAMGVFDDETLTLINQTYQRADAFLFGRRTYELFAGYWGVREDLEHPIVGALNT